MQSTASLLTTSRPPGIAWLWRGCAVLGATAIGMIAAAATWQWSWLTAIGVAPVLLNLAPCAAMCGLGLCMQRMGGRTCAPAPQDRSTVRGTLANPSATQET